MNVSTAWLIILCAGCSVRPLDLEGKPCPCLPGYVCDTASNTCVRSLPADAREPASCLATEVGAQLYATGFDDFTGWAQGGDGSWMVNAGEAVQSDSTSTFAHAFNPVVTVADYRIVSTFRAINGMGTTAVELAARVQLDGSGGQYHCNWDPINGEFSLMYSTSATSTGYLQTIYIDVGQLPGYDPGAWFTMEFQVRGSRLDCCVRGVGGAAGFANDTRFGLGPPGMKTFLVAAAYDDFRVLGLP